MASTDELKDLSPDAHPHIAMDAAIQTSLGAPSSTGSTPPSSTPSTSHGINPPRNSVKWTGDEKDAFNELCRKLLVGMTTSQINRALQTVTDRMKSMGYHKTLQQCRQQWYGSGRFLPEFHGGPAGPRVMSPPSNDDASPVASRINTPNAALQVEKTSPTPAAAPTPATAPNNGATTISRVAAADSQHVQQRVNAEALAPGHNKTWSSYEREMLTELVNAYRSEELNNGTVQKLGNQALMEIISGQLKDRHGIDRTPAGCSKIWRKLAQEAMGSSAPAIPPMLSPLSKDTKAKLGDAALLTNTKTNAQNKKALQARKSATGKSYQIIRWSPEHKQLLIEEAKKTLYPSEETINRLADELQATVKRIKEFFSNARSGNYSFTKNVELGDGADDAEYADMPSNSPGTKGSRKSLKRGRTDDSINLDTDDDDYPLVLRPPKKPRTDAARTMRNAPTSATGDDTPAGKIKMILPPRDPALPLIPPSRPGNPLGEAPSLPRKSPTKKVRQSTGSFTSIDSQSLDRVERWKADTLLMIKDCDETIASRKNTKAQTLAEISTDDAAAATLQTKITALQQQLLALTNSINAKKSTVGDLDAQINKAELRKKHHQLALEYED